MVRLGFVLHNDSMTAGRGALFMAVLAVGGLAVAFVFLSAGVAGQVEAAVSALAAVAAVGTGVWAALPHGGKGDDHASGVTAEQTGLATAEGAGSAANSGVRGAGAAKATGDATATGGGRANTGVDSSGDC